MDGAESESTPNAPMTSMTRTAPLGTIADCGGGAGGTARPTLVGSTEKASSCCSSSPPASTSGVCRDDATGFAAVSAGSVDVAGGSSRDDFFGAVCFRTSRAVRAAGTAAGNVLLAAVRACTSPARGAGGEPTRSCEVFGERSAGLRTADAEAAATVASSDDGGGAGLNTGGTKRCRPCVGGRSPRRR